MQILAFLPLQTETVTTAKERWKNESTFLPFRIAHIWRKTYSNFVFVTMSGMGIELHPFAKFQASNISLYTLYLQRAVSGERRTARCTKAYAHANNGHATMNNRYDIESNGQNGGSRTALRAHPTQLHSNIFHFSFFSFFHPDVQRDM